MPTEKFFLDEQHPFIGVDFCPANSTAKSAAAFLAYVDFASWQTAATQTGRPLLTTALKNIIALTVAERKRAKAEEREREIKVQRMCACVLFVVVLHIPSGVRRPWAFER